MQDQSYCGNKMVIWNEKGITLGPNLMVPDANFSAKINKQNGDLSDIYISTHLRLVFKETRGWLSQWVNTKTGSSYGGEL